MKKHLFFTVPLLFYLSLSYGQMAGGDTVRYTAPYDFSVVSPSDWWLNVAFDSSYIQSMAPQPPALLISTTAWDAKTLQADGFTKAMQQKFLNDASKKGFKFIKVEHKTINGLPVTVATYSFLNFMDEEILQIDYMVSKNCGTGKTGIVFTVIIPKSQLAERQSQVALMENSIVVKK